MKLLCKILLAFAFAFTVGNGNALFAQFGGGNGTYANPYQIKTRQHLELLADSVNNGNNWSKNKYFKVMNDITDTVRTVIGRTETNNSGYERFFQGHFDGQNHKIVLGIINNSSNNVGLFGCIYSDDNSVITISNVTVEGYVKSLDSGWCVAGIVAFSSIEIMGKQNGIIVIKNCINNCDVTNTNSLPDDFYVSMTGGIIGFQEIHGNIENCINNGKIIGDGVLGGISGRSILMGKIVNCTNTGEISSISSRKSIVTAVGGILGDDAFGIIENCINSGRISGDSLVGGISGCSRYSKITNCINIGTVKEIL